MNWDNDWEGKVKNAFRTAKREFQRKHPEEEKVDYIKMVEEMLDWAKVRWHGPGFWDQEQKYYEVPQLNPINLEELILNHAQPEPLAPSLSQAEELKPVLYRN